MEPSQAPVLVFGSGQRSGSTLVQRLLTSHRGVLIWGEHGGHLRDLFAMTTTLRAWDRYVSAGARPEFERGGHDSWMANLLPGDEAILAAARAYLLAWFGKPAAAQRRPRWGFKEVRFGHDEASMMRELFPAVRVVHITRDPRDMLVSLDRWEGDDPARWSRDYTQRAVHDWVSVNRTFREAPAEDWVLSCRYEDIVQEPQAFIADLARLLDTKPPRFDAAVFDKRIAGAAGTERGPRRTWEQLPADLRALLDTEDVRQEATSYGYDLP